LPQPDIGENPKAGVPYFGRETRCASLIARNALSTMGLSFALDDETRSHTAIRWVIWSAY
jgi:hypothetical protein